MYDLPDLLDQLRVRLLEVKPIINNKLLVKVRCWLPRGTARELIFDHEVRDSGNASTNVALTYDNYSHRKKIGWDVKPSMNSITAQLTELVAAILPPELCPKTMYKADAKQLMKAVMPENGTGHETNNTIKKERFFEQKLFAVIRSRMNALSYMYDDESAEDVKKADKKDNRVNNEKTPVKQCTLKDATDEQLLTQLKKRGLLPDAPIETEIEEDAGGESAKA